MMRYTGMLLIAAMLAVLSCTPKAPRIDSGAGQPSSSPAPAVPSHKELRLTQSRMGGDDVLLLQRKLLALGFKELGDADGWFGPKTESAVQRFKDYLGFASAGVVTGIVDDAVWKALLSPSPIVARFYADLVTISGYDLSGPFPQGDLGQTPAGGRYTADWYSAGIGVQAVMVVENPPETYGEDDAPEYPGGWMVFPFEDRWIISRVNKSASQPSLDLQNLSPLYILDHTVYNFKDGEEMALTDADDLLAMVETIGKTVIANPQK